MIKSLRAALWAAFLFAAALPAAAQLTRPQLQGQINTNIHANGQGAITGTIMNGVMNNMTASFCMPDGVQCPGDVRSFGCAVDGSDQTACVNNALATYSGCVFVPPSVAGLGISGTLVVNTCLVGASYQPSNPWPSDAFPGTSWIKCLGTTNTACVLVGTAGSLSVAPYLGNLIISGQTEPAASGSIGLQHTGAFNANEENVMVNNFDTCVKYGPQGSISPITFTSQNPTIGRCKTNFMTIDGTPEVKVNLGRFGLNGHGDYPASNAFVAFQKTTDFAGGMGPNTILFLGTHFNPGTGGGVRCAFSWETWTGTNGVQAEFRFQDNHVEWHSYTGGGTQGTFCTDSTVPSLSDLWVDGMLTATGGITVPLFSIDPATTPSQWHFTDDVFSCTGTVTLNTGAPASQSASDLHFSEVQFCGGALSITAGNANSRAYFSDDAINVLTLAGQWGHLAVNGSAIPAGLNDTATGHIELSQVFPQPTFTPVLKFGGAVPTGITYSAQAATITRTSSGGLRGYVNITLTNLGTGPAGGDPVAITGSPYTCGSGSSGDPAQAAGSFSGLTSAPSASMSGANVILSQANTTGVGTLTFSNFGNATHFVATFSCLNAQ